jgi:CubicO group peptidase (beta-lactamase class C family)
MLKINTILAFSLLLLLSSCHVGRFFVWNFADIKDYKKFASVPIAKDSSYVFQFAEPEPDAEGPFKNPRLTIKGREIPMLEALQKEGTAAFLIIRNDTLLLEHYFKGFDTASIVPSFSAAKSYVSALLGIAIDEGFIRSVDDSITRYIPTLPADPYAKITLRHLLDMRSGLKFNESYINPFGHVAKSYYGMNLKKFTGTLKAKGVPDSSFEYISVNTQLIGWAIENATGKKLSQYLEEKIWKPLGMEYPATWSIDSKKHRTEKAFCCLNARARDYAKFGRLFLNKGNWNGKQIISEAWIAESLDFDEQRFYSYQWWRRPRREDGGQQDFYANGFLGQYIYVNPKKSLIIVRLGKKDGDLYWPGIFQALSDQL